MTAPVQEPSTPRDIGGISWATQQLARRPRPGGLGSLSDWAYLNRNTSMNVSDTAYSGSPTTITPENYAIAPGSQAFDIDTFSKRMEIGMKGFYMFYWASEWSGGSAGLTDLRRYGMTVSGGGQWDNTDSTFLPRNVSADPYLEGVTFTLGPLHANAVFSGGSGSLKLGWNVQQHSGSTQTLINWSLTAVFLGTGLGIDDGVTNWSSLVTAF